METNFDADNRQLDHPPSPQPDAKPFRLLELPRELRDRVYEYMLVTPDIIVSHAGYAQELPGHPYYSTYYGGNQICVNILWVSSQVNDETMPILYGKNTISLEELDFPGMLKFLRKHVPATALGKIRNLKIEFYEVFANENEAQPCDGHDYDPFQEFFRFLRSHCQLHYLSVCVKNGSTGYHTEEISGVPAWVQPLLQVKELRRLRVSWKYKDSVYFKRTINTAKLMRSTMLEEGNVISGTEGMRVRLRHIKYDDAREPGRFMDFEMDIEKTHSRLGKDTRRVKVQPYKWCKICGHFVSTNWRCNCCSAPFSFSQRDCSDKHNKWLILESEDESESAVRTLSDETSADDGSVDATSTAEVTDEAFDKTTTETASNDKGNIWDSRNWYGGPWKDYLPLGVNEEDFLAAKALADDGYDIEATLWSHNPYGGLDYTDSDFGDRDSLLSVHGWSDDEGDDDEGLDGS